ncbi:MAG: hypothetical protein J5659_05715 [Clostridia bacterium]|nr:hypothetical protein [Clostridia bacterium]
MRASDIFKRAMRLCGISEEVLDENDLTDLHARALDAINTALFDLCGVEGVSSLSDLKDIPAKTADAVVYGTAMLLSLAYGDTDKSSLFSSVFNQKRAAIKSNISKIADVLPRTEAI